MHLAVICRVRPPQTSARRDAKLRRGLAAVDVLAAFASLVLVTRLIDPGEARLQLGTILIAPLTVLAAKLMGLYDRDANVLGKTTIDEVPSLAYLSVVYALGAWLLEAVLLDGYLGRSQVFGLLLLMLVLDAGGRLLVRRIAFGLTPPQRCIVLGEAADAERIAGKLAGAPSVSAVVVGRVPLHPVGDQVEDSGIPRLGDYETLARIVAEHHVERAIIAAHGDGQDEILDAIRLMKALQVKVSVLPRLLEVVGSTSTFDDVDGLWLLGVRRYGLGRSSELIKRATDIAVAAAALVIFGPLLLMLMLAVKLDSPGPVFFRQSRIGQRGERFWMLKLRSMVVDAEARKAELQQHNEAQGGMFKISDDPRITRVGRALRRTSLDELPQLLNVLTGDMSLVGPRPLIPDEDSADHRLAAPPAVAAARDDGALADLRIISNPDERDGQDRLPLWRQLVVVARSQDPSENDSVRPQPPRLVVARDSFGASEAPPRTTRPPSRAGSARSTPTATQPAT